MDEALLVYTTWPDAETAGSAAVAAVEARLAACANVLARISSVFRYEGVIERAVETPVVFKTTTGTAERLCAFIVSRHPYELPCVIAMPITATGSHPAFLDWIGAVSGEN